MKRLVIFTIVFLSFSKGFSQSFHQFSLIDQRLITYKADQANIDEMGNHLVGLLKIAKKEPVSQDPVKYSYAQLQEAINEINEKDILLFYFAGEGSRKAKGSRATERQVITFSDKSVTHKEIIDLVKKRKPKVAILLMEGSDRQVLINEEGYRRDHAGAVSRESALTLFNYKKEQEEVRIIVYMNATEPPSPARKNRRTGSYFLSSFKNNLYDQLGESNPDWNKVIRQVEVQVMEFTKNVQTPYGEIYPIR